MSEGYDVDVVVSKINLLNGNLVLFGWNFYFYIYIKGFIFSSRYFWGIKLFEC